MTIYKVGDCDDCCVGCKIIKYYVYFYSDDEKDSYLLTRIAVWRRTELLNDYAYGRTGSDLYWLEIPFGESVPAQSGYTVELGPEVGDHVDWIHYVKYIDCDQADDPISP